MQNSQNDSGLRLLLFLSHTVSSRSQRHGPVRVLPGEEACLWRSVAGGRGRVCRVCTNRTVLLFTSVFARTDTCSCTHVCPCAHRTDSHTHDFINRFPSVPTGADTRAHIRAGTQRARVWTAADAVCAAPCLCGCTRRVSWLGLSTRVGACAGKPGPTVAGVRMCHGPASSSVYPRSPWAVGALWHPAPAPSCPPLASKDAE